MSGTFLKGVWKVREMCQEGVEIVFRGYLEGILRFLKSRGWCLKSAGWCLYYVWMVSGTCQKGVRPKIFYSLFLLE